MSGFWDQAYAPGGTVSLSYSGSATSGVDYQVLTTSVSIPPNPNPYPGFGGFPFSVQLLADNLVEPAETLVVSLTSATGGLVLRPYLAPDYVDVTPYETSTVTISDDPPIVWISASDADAEEVYSGPANPGLLTICRTGGDLSTPIAVGIGYTGSATHGTDYTALTTVNVCSSATVGVNMVDDDLDEGEETIIASVSDGGSVYLLGSPAAATVKARDNDITLTASCSDTQWDAATRTLTIARPVTGTTSVFVELTAKSGTQTKPGVVLDTMWGTQGGPQTPGHSEPSATNEQGKTGIVFQVSPTTGVATHTLILSRDGQNLLDIKIVVTQ